MYFYGFYIIFELEIALSIKEQNKKESKLMKKTFSLFICSMMSIMCFTSPILANEDTLNEQNLTEEKKKYLKRCLKENKNI